MPVIAPVSATATVLSASNVASAPVPTDVRIVPAFNQEAEEARWKQVETLLKLDFERHHGLCTALLLTLCSHGGAAAPLVDWPAAFSQFLWPSTSTARTTTTTPGCPPANFTSVAPFNLTAYIAAPWFVQAQMPVSFQPADKLFCVRAKYTLMDERTSNVSAHVCFRIAALFLNQT